MRPDRWPTPLFLTTILCLTLAPDARGAADERTVDFAEASQCHQWLRHPVLGDPSYDSFTHAASNPIYRGAAPYEWPVNGFLFRDPVGGAWYLYVGHYPANYAITTDAPMRCTVFRSTDQGKKWEHLGPIFAGPPHVYDGETSPTAHAPDVTVVYADGRYHLCFDWLTGTSTWQNAADPPADANGGVGYAWSERPEGPFHITSRPIAAARSQPLLLGKYRRLYLSTIVRRQHDWLVLTDVDSGLHFGWGLVGMTAERPEGPYCPAKLLLHPESPRFHPPLVEFNPAFTHDGSIYMPASSIAANRNYQVLFRVPIERAMDPDAWEIAQSGSLWHSEPVEHETYGIWGQTFSGFVGPDGLFNVFFPSRDSKGMGTVNLASRPWDRPLRPSGFVVSGHEAPTLCYLKQAGPARRIEADLDRIGTVSLIWNAEGLVGTDHRGWLFQVHPQARRSFVALQLAPQQWSLLAVDAAGQRRTIGSGPLAAAPAVRVALEWKDDRTAVLSIGNAKVWQGEVPTGPGCIGIMCEPRSRSLVRRLAITGPAAPARVRYLYSEAIIGAAQLWGDWPARESKAFRYGLGAVSAKGGLRAKWNFEGTALTLWAPKSPEFGQADLLLDGRRVATVDFSSDRENPSAPVYEAKGLSPETGHALILQAGPKSVPLDVLEIAF